MDTQDLIYLTACAVNGVTPDAERIAGMDLAALYDLADRHMLAATAAPALNAAGVHDERFDEALKHSALKNALMDMEMNALFAKLDAAGIWHLPLKGIVLQHLYPIYGMRQMSDHDILFDADRAEDVKNIMLSLGFSVVHFGTGHQDMYHKLPVSNFEMHRILFQPERRQRLYDYYSDLPTRLLGDGFEKHLSPEDFYLYMIAHEYKHYTVSGTGLRSLLDTYVYLQKESPDMAYVAAEAEKMGIAQFEEQNRTLALRLFTGKELTAEEQKMLDYFMHSGVYGNFDSRVEHAVRSGGGSRLRYALRRFFVPISRKNRDYEQFARQYPLFYRYRILLPLLPFYRLFLALRSGKLKAEARALKKAKK